MQKNIFISHSSKDKPFVRKLDSALSSQGVKVFLDERDIKVGDSIPDSIYEALSVSTHILYVVSINSVSSAWVKEELSIAKMRQNENDGLRILPILLDDMELPTAVKHIKYASFINWQSSNIFISSMNEIFKSLGVGLKYAVNEEIVFYFKYLQEYNDVERIVLELGTIFDTALYVPRGVEPYVSSDVHSRESLFDISRWLVKYMVDPVPINEIMKFRDIANNHHPWGKEAKLSIIINLINEFLLPINKQQMYHVDPFIDATSLSDISQLLKRISGVMENLRLDISSTIGSNCQI